MKTTFENYGTTYNGDCFDILKDIQDSSIDLILIDPPYGTVKGIVSENSTHGMKGKVNWDIKLDTPTLFNESARLLKRNSKLVVFSQEPYTSELNTSNIALLQFSYKMFWYKNHFANSLIAKKAPVSHCEEISVFNKMYDTTESEARAYSRRIFEYIGLPKNDIYRVIGNRRCEHFFRFESKQHAKCSQPAYNELIQHFNIDKMDGFLSYNEMKKLFDSQPKSIFNLPKGQKFKSNVLQYPKDKNGIHPTQKPIALLEDLIYTYTNEDSTVLDFTSGSGSTAIACINQKRKFILVERDITYYEKANDRIDNHIKAIDTALF